MMHPYIMTAIAAIIIIALMGTIGAPLAERGLAALFSPIAGLWTVPGETYLVGGMSIESITATKTIVSNADLSGTYYYVVVSATGNTESIIGSTIGSESFKQQGAIPTGMSLDKDLRIDLTSINEKQKFTVINTGTNPIYKLTVSVCDADKIKSAKWTFGSTCPPLSCPAYCVFEQQAAVQAPLEYSQYQSTVTGKVNDEAFTVTNEQTSSTFTHGSVEWLGGTSSGNIGVNPHLYGAYYDKQASYWKIYKVGGMSDYENTKSAYSIVSGSLNSYRGCTVCDTNIILADVNNYNGKVASFLANDFSLGNDYAWQNRNVQSGDVGLMFDPAYRTIIPRLRFRVQASWLGIETAIGTPKINSVTAPDFSSGDRQGRISASITNTGTATGTFQISLDGCSKFTQTAVLKEQFTAGATKTLTIPITTTGSAVDTTETCNVKVCDTSGFGTCVTKSVTIHMKEAQWCQAGATIYEGGCIKKCKADGSGYEQVKCCPYGADVGLTGQYDCKAASGGVGLDFGKILNMLIIAAILAGMIVALLAFMPLILAMFGIGFLTTIGAFVRKKIVWIFIIVFVILLVMFLMPTGNATVASLFHATSAAMHIPI